MFGRTQKPLTAAQTLSLFVQQAAEELQSEREKLEAFQVLFRGAAAMAAHCESQAIQRGSPAAHAFRTIGHASRGMAVGTDRAIAALPAVDPAAAQAVRNMLGMPEPKAVEAEEEDDVMPSR
jgi:hypothetical protein